MKNKKNFRIRRSAKLEELATGNPVLKKALQKIVGGNTNSATGTYSRVMGLIVQE